MFQRGDKTNSPNEDKNHNPGLIKEAWDFSARSDEEILRNTTYKFNLPVEKLINNSNDTRLAKRNKRNGTKKIPRRQNAWIIYRRDKCVSPEFYGLKSALISQKIGIMWEAEPEEIKGLFGILEKMSDTIHKNKYEGYVYKPRSPKAKRKPKKIQQKKEMATNVDKAYNPHLHVFSVYEKAPAASSSSEFVSPVTNYPPSPISLVDEVLPSSNVLETEVSSTMLPTPTESTSNSPIFPTTTSPVTEESNALGLIIPTPNLNSPPSTVTSDTCSPGLTQTISNFFPETSMITPLTLEYENNLLVDTRSNFFSTPSMTPFLEEIGPVCDLSQTNNNRQSGDWVLYPIDNPREIEVSQFSDYISH